MENRLIHLEGPNPLWKSKFEIEKARLEAILQEACVKVHHIGSTAIRGISAKPVVDILIEADSLDGIDARNEEMARAGFKAKGENGIPRRRYFQMEELGVRTVHVHAFVKGDIQIARHLAFRDGMNANPELAEEYDRVKNRALERSGGASAKYQELKGYFVEDMTRRFLKAIVASEKGNP